MSHSSGSGAGDGDRGGDAPKPGVTADPWVRLRTMTRHPLIFQKMIDEVSGNAKAGGVVAVFDRAGALVGQGLYHPTSQIAVRLLTRGSKRIDATFWKERLGQAVELRRMLGLDRATDAYRLVHAEGDDLSGLIVERYADCLVFEFFSLGMFQRLEQIRAILGELLGPPSSLDRPGKVGSEWRVFVRADKEIEQIEGFSTRAVAGEEPPVVTVREHGVRYRVDVAKGHKTGFFCDQRDNRRMFAESCRDATVLDLCCYTGGFGLSAKKIGEAKDVTCVDLDEAALAIARENANLNNARISFVHSDAFIYLRQMIVNARKFDAVVLDPPKLATSRPELEGALRKYYDLNCLAMQAVRPGGMLLTCSCSGLVSYPEFVELVLRAVKRAGRNAQVLRESGASPDHPVSDDCPESSYLKAIFLRIL
jgi:23S rRNA (cytosine1962-C5)-methyltransferase